MRESTIVGKVDMLTCLYNRALQSEPEKNVFHPRCHHVHGQSDVLTCWHCEWLSVAVTTSSWSWRCDRELFIHILAPRKSYLQQWMTQTLKNNRKTNRISTFSSFVFVSLYDFDASHDRSRDGLRFRLWSALWFASNALWGAPFDYCTGELVVFLPIAPIFTLSVIHVLIQLWYTQWFILLVKCIHTIGL
jgi:hypothetical protein